MKNIYKKWWFWLLITLIIISIPFVINELYKLNKGYETLWEAKDILQFYGSFLAFLGTVVLGIVATWQTKESHKINANLLNLESKREKEKLFEMYFSFIEETGKIFDPKYIFGDFAEQRRTIQIYFMVKECKSKSLSIKRRLIFLDIENSDNAFLKYAMNKFEEATQITQNYNEENKKVASELLKFMRENADEFNLKSLEFIQKIHQSIFGPDGKIKEMYTD